MKGVTTVEMQVSCYDRATIIELFEINDLFKSHVTNMSPMLYESEHSLLNNHVNV